MGLGGANNDGRIIPIPLYSDLKPRSVVIDIAVKCCYRNGRCFKGQSMRRESDWNPNRVPYGQVHCFQIRNGGGFRLQEQQQDQGQWQDQHLLLSTAKSPTEARLLE